MLFPIQNKYRSLVDLSGFWKFKVDAEQTGENSKWFKGFDPDYEIAVPGSWNEQLSEDGLLHYVGSVWYSKKFFVPLEWGNKSISIRFESVDYYAKVWINGKYIGENKLAFLPFEFEISNFVNCGEVAEIIVLASNLLEEDTIPQGIMEQTYLEENRLRDETFPPARFDFSPFGGIHRPIYLVAKPKICIENIKVDTSISGLNGILDISLMLNCETDAQVILVIKEENHGKKKIFSFIGGKAKAQVLVEDCQFWSPQSPKLYNLLIYLVKDGNIVDEYTLPIGIRDVKIINNKLMLNGKEIYLKGFGKHEDFAVIGKGLFLPLIVKDFQLMKWINANSFRTSHYPYAHETMDYADQKGILIIDEIPAVSLDFRFVTDRTLLMHKEYINRLFDRDYNHPSVIIWALGNEPNLVGDGEYYNGKAKKYWEEVFAHSRSVDPKRPKTVPNCLRAGIEDPVLALSDIISLNRYYGWYEYPGRLSCGLKALEEELDTIFAKYNKPMMLTEFGVDTVPGYHSSSDQMFTEEYQEKFLEKYIRLLRSKNFIIGEHVWNFADFRTPQHFRRVVFNMKGVFTRERDPKTAAFRLKEIWSQTNN